MKNHRNHLPFKTMGKFMFCLIYVSNHQWSPWKQIRSGSLRSYVQEQSLIIFIITLKTKGPNILLQGMSPSALGCDQASLSSWVLSPTAEFTREKAGLSGAQGSRCKIFFLYVLYISPKFLPGKVTHRSTLSTKKKTCPTECAPARPTAAGRAIWPRPVLAAVSIEVAP